MMGRFLFAMCHASISYIRVWDYPNKFFHFRVRDLKIRKIASVATLAVLATLPFPYISNFKTIDLATISS